MTAQQLLRENIKALLRARKEDSVALARWMGHDKSWINKILNGHRDMPIEHFDRVADFFGLATYQLFQPGISPLLERRVRVTPRRSGLDRRVGHTQQEMRQLAAEIEHKRRRPADLNATEWRIIQHLRDDADAMQGIMAVLEVPSASRPSQKGEQRPSRKKTS